MANAFKEGLWICSFLSLLKLPVPRPFPILSDNQATCALSNSIAISARSKHIDIRHHFIRDLVQAGSFSTTWIPTTDMPADISLLFLFLVIVMFLDYLFLLLSLSFLLSFRPDGGVL